MDDLVKKLKAQIDSVKNENYNESLSELKDLNTKLDKQDAFARLDLSKKLSSLQEYNPYFSKNELEELVIFVETMGKGTSVSSNYVKAEEYIGVQKTQQT